MRKWTYLVAALLMGGVTTSLTSCIDNEEPAGITDLRGAKAELLRAKAKVQEAEAAYKTAQIAIEEAKAAYLQEKVAQEKLETELKAAKTEAQKEKIKQQMQLRAEEFKAELLAAQTHSLKADAAYKQALIDIELALSTYKEDKYAQELKDFLSGTTENGQFTYNVPYFKSVSYDENGLSYVIEEKQVTVYGYNSLVGQVSRAQHELVQLLDGKAKYEFNPQIDVLTEENNAWIAKLEGEIKADEELLAKYKSIAGKTVSEWETEYEQLEKDIEAEEAKQDEIDLQKAKDLIPLNEELKNLENAANVTSPVKFEIGDLTCDDFTSRLDQALWQISLSSERRNIISQEIISQQSRNEEGNIVYPNGLTLNLTNQELAELLNHQEWNEWSENWDKSLLQYIQDVAALKNDWDGTSQDANGATIDQQTLKKYEVNMNDAKGALGAVVEDWTPVRDKFLAAAETYRYNYKSENATNRYDGRTSLIKEVDAYLKIAKPTDEEKANIIGAISDYLKGRKVLDAFDPMYIPDGENAISYADALADADLKDDALTSFLASYANDKEDVISTDGLSTDEKGLYGQFYSFVKVIWGESLNVVPITNRDSETGEEWYAGHYLEKTSVVKLNKYELMTQEEWEMLPYKALLKTLYNDNKIIDNKGYVIWIDEYQNVVYQDIIGDGLLNDYLAATSIYNSMKERLEKNAAWKTFSASVEKINETVQGALQEYNSNVASINVKKAEIEAKATQDKAAIEVKIEGLEALKEVLDLALNQVVGNETTIQQLKNMIAEIEGGIVIESGEGEKETEGYVVGSIAEKKALIEYYENFNKAIADGTYEKPLDTTLQWYEDQIEVKQTEIELLNALYIQATKKKDMLLEVITGGSSSTPVDPAPEEPSEGDGGETAE